MVGISWDGIGDACKIKVVKLTNAAGDGSRALICSYPCRCNGCFSRPIKLRFGVVCIPINHF